jgi:hypothetical protein
MKLSVFLSGCLLAAPLWMQIQAQKRVLIVGEEVNLRTTASAKSKKIASLSLGQTAKVLQITPKREVVGGDAQNHCDAYFWYKIQTQDGKTGWVYGKYAFGLDNVVPIKYAKTNQLLFDGVEYQLFYADNLGTPVDMNGDISGCSEDDYLVFVPKNTALKAQPIYLQKSKYNWQEAYLNDARNLLALAESDGGSHTIDLSKSKYDSEKETLTLECEFNGQDSYRSGATVEVKYDPATQQFKAYFVDYKMGD